MRTYAYTTSIAGTRTVRELITTDDPTAKHPSVTDLLVSTGIYSAAFLADCLDVTSVSPAPAERWTYDGAAFAAPAAPVAAPNSCFVHNFTDATTVTIAHGCASENVTIQISSGAAAPRSIITPATTTIVNADTVEITFAAPTTGRAIVCAVR